mmetsp:Transcript_57043/g.116748  ORF Transcript_57043/g.116748 Transcript_57043/m.116748 type:complete len:507 (+) Transcript_57043:129-1649(+)
MPTLPGMIESPAMSAVPTQRQMGELRPEDTPAYQVLKRGNLLNSTYRIDSADDIDAVEANSTAWKNCLLNIFCCPFKCFFRTFETPAGCVTLVEDGRGGYEFRKQGVHLICDPFYSVKGYESFGQNTIVHGDRTLLVVEQGKIGFALEKGQPVLLPPGMHQWKSPTLVFEQSFDLNNNVIRMGPLTLATVDEGYSAVTEDNGRQVILKGGDTYLLNHRNWKFKKFVSEKIHSNDMKRILATSADNVLMAVDATVIWRIDNVDTAAKNAAETINSCGGEERHQELDDISKLSNDVLKQAEASLAAFIGGVNYSDKFNVATAVQDPQFTPAAGSTSDLKEYVADAKAAMTRQETVSLFDVKKLQTCVQHANHITETYGVRIISINVVAAVPADEKLQTSLAQGAVAAAEAQKFETVARGRASAALIEAKGLADASIMRAKGDAESEIIRADGSRAAADKLQDSEVAVRFQMVEKTGVALAEKSSFFFGAEAHGLDTLLAPAMAAAVHR